MSSFIAYIKFKHLFDSLEIIANYNGSIGTRETFDSNLSYIINVKAVKISNWRELYNRLKHAARNQEDIHKIATFATDLSREYELLMIREKCAALIKQRINEVYGSTQTR